MFRSTTLYFIYGNLPIYSAKNKKKLKPDRKPDPKNWTAQKQYKNSLNQFIIILGWLRPPDS